MKVHDTYGTGLLRNGILCLGILYMLSSCSTTMYTQESGPLYSGAKVEYEDIADPGSRADIRIRKEVEGIIVPAKVPWIARQKFSLLLERKSKKDRETFLKNKIGKTPLFYPSITPPVKNVQNIVKLLASRGYFNADVSYRENQKDDQISIIYEVKLPQQYTINSIVYPSASDPVSILLNREMEHSLLKSGDPYDLGIMSAERKRLVKIMKEEGYYKFYENQLLFSVDSSHSGHVLDIALNYLPGDENGNKLYRINNLVLRTVYNIPEIDKSMHDTIRTPNFTYIGDSTLINSRLFEQMVLIRKDSLYSIASNELSIKRLLSLSIFNSVSIDYREKDSLLLDCYIDCILKQEHSINLDLYLTSKSNNLAGPGLKLEYQYLNVFGAGENLKVRAISGFETQFNNTRRGFETYHLGTDLEFTVPRLLFPVRLKKRSTPKPSQTIFNLGYEILNRRDYYNLRSFYVNAGYLLNSRQDRIKFEIYPLVVNYTKPGKISDEFSAILAENPFYASGFQQKFILGSQFNLNTGIVSKKNASKFLLGTSFENSGSALDLANKKLNLGIEENYSHFTKISLDARYSLPFYNTSSIVLRCFTGLGIPLGDAETLPYIKQFYSGGPNSIRAFNSRSVGPGTFVRPVSSSDNPYFDQSGDIKLEVNAEYRFPIIKYLKGAVFADAGNIWLVNENADIPGGQFQFNSFMRQLAVGTGVGIRFDITYFVLRLDLATPLRKPFDATPWQFNDFDFGDRTWRRENLVFNLAIGYPF